MKVNKTRRKRYCGGGSEEKQRRNQSFAGHI
jgi:hypothetical protein